MSTRYGLLCRDEFSMDKDHSYLNHASFGAVPNIIQEKRFELLKIQERNTHQWMFQAIEPLWKENLYEAAKFLGSNPENLMLVPNTTSAISSLLKCIPFKANDAILCNSWTFDTIKQACRSIISQVGGELLNLKMSIPIYKPNNVIEMYKTMLANHPNIKLVILDLISCPTAMQCLMPELIALCKEHNVLILVDGAHGPGHIPLHLEDMGESGVDFFVGSFHKWMFCPRGCAAMWIKSCHHELLCHSMPSGSSTYLYQHKNFLLQGALDMSPYFVIKDAIHFYQSHGGLEAITAYNTALADEAVSLLVNRWQTYSFPIAKSMEAPFMRLVRLPHLPMFPVSINARNGTVSNCEGLMENLYDEYNITAMIRFVEGQLWVRISCQIYNTIEDYERLAEAVLDMKYRMRNITPLA